MYYCFQHGSGSKCDPSRAGHWHRTAGGHPTPVTFCPKWVRWTTPRRRCQCQKSGTFFKVTELVWGKELLFSQSGWLYPIVTAYVSIQWQPFTSSFFITITVSHFWHSPPSNFYFWIRTLRRKMVYGIIFPSFWLFPCKINHSQKSDFFFSCWLPPFSLCSSPAMLPGSTMVSLLPLLLPSRTKSKTTQSVHHSQGHIW